MYGDEKLQEPSLADLKEKMRMQDQANMACGTVGCARVCLRDRVEQQANEAERQGAKARHLFELSQLLAKNPEIARILDLLEEVRG